MISEIKQFKVTQAKKAKLFNWTLKFLLILTQTTLSGNASHSAVGLLWNECYPTKQTICFSKGMVLGAYHHW